MAALLSMPLVPAGQSRGQGRCCLSYHGFTARGPGSGLQFQVYAALATPLQVLGSHGRALLLSTGRTRSHNCSEPKLHLSKEQPIQYQRAPLAYYLTSGQKCYAAQQRNQRTGP